MIKKQEEIKKVQGNSQDAVHDESVLNPEKVHESDLTRRERRLIEKEKIKGMGLGKKLEYIWMYYKMAIFGVIGFIALIFIGIDWYEHAKIVTVLGISVVNSGSIETETLSADIKEMLGYEDKYSEVSISSNLSSDAEGKYFDYYAQMAYLAQIQAKAIDVLVMPEGLIDSANIDDLFMDMKDVLDEETYEALGDNVKDGYITLSGIPLRQKLAVGYEPVCFAVPSNSENIENAGKWLASLVSEPQE